MGLSSPTPEGVGIAGLVVKPDFAEAPSNPAAIWAICTSRPIYLKTLRGLSAGSGAGNTTSRCNQYTCTEGRSG